MLLAKKLINYKTHSQKKTCDLTDLPDQKDAGPTDMDYDVSITQLGKHLRWLIRVDEIDL